MYDKAPEAVGLATKPDAPGAPTLPAEARLPINRCNLPAVVLGSLTFQRHPAPLQIDGTHALHHRLFDELAMIGRHTDRARRFMQYMAAHFLLDNPEEAGLDPGRGRGRGRAKADYLRTLRGWLFDTESREAAVLKGWVESRFGLLPRYHKTAIHAPGEEAYTAFMAARTAGLYNTNALESQLDLLYTYCQYELVQRHEEETHLTLFRGINHPDEHEVLSREGRRRQVVILNNLNSFTDNRERADEFGDHILTVQVPLSKVFAFNRLLPGVLQGEDEFMVIGGVYEVDTLFI